MKIKDIQNLINLITGWDLSLWELFKASERSINLARIFNIKHGFSTEDDDLPERYFEPLKSGMYDGTAIDKGAFYEALEIYYQLRGWDNKGIPTYGKLVELGIEQLNLT